jgi:hypothetical protein
MADAPGSSNEPNSEKSRVAYNLGKLADKTRNPKELAEKAAGSSEETAALFNAPGNQEARQNEGKG